MLIIVLFFIVVLVWVLAILGKKSKPEAQTGNLKYFGFRKNDHSISIWPLNSKIGGQIEFYIAGVYYRQDGIEGYLGETEGTLVAENDNPHDSNAIKVLAADGHHLGYVPRQYTIDVRKAVKLPCKCYCYIAKHVENGEVSYFTDCYVPLSKSN